MENSPHFFVVPFTVPHGQGYCAVHAVAVAKHIMDFGKVFFGHETWEEVPIKMNFIFFQ